MHDTWEVNEKIKESLFVVESLQRILDDCEARFEDLYVRAIETQLELIKTFTVHITLDDK